MLVQVDRALDVYNMIHEYNIKGSPELYTIAVNSCSQNGDWESACNVYNDMNQKGIVPDEVILLNVQCQLVAGFYNNGSQCFLRVVFVVIPTLSNWK